ncbi:MAG: hypothetical protein RMK18_08515 [Armatimonadota bacterium]|nr:hypothetical protein [Armatimonadota bacterium]MCX7777639.1 hypothetical protein [Armatimonadota bacterium]MDW8025885.1 hypothetical protein [Armatimonadota bacterium]
MEHAQLIHLFVVSAVSLLILYGILSSMRGRKLFIRRLPGIDAIEEAVGRATEMGRPMLFSVGLGGVEVETFQALAIAGHVARLAGRYRNRVIVPVIDTVVYTIAEEVLKEAYAEAGHPDAFRREDVRFLSGSQFAYASGVIGIMNREKVAANFFFGPFAAESLILAETGQSLGAIQIAGTASTLQVPFFIAACDYTIIGEEFYAASAYLSRDPIHLGSVVGQDYSKILLAAFTLSGMTIATLSQYWTELNGLLKFLTGGQ